MSSADQSSAADSANAADLQSVADQAARITRLEVQMSGLSQALNNRFEYLNNSFNAMSIDNKAQAQEINNRFDSLMAMIQQQNNNGTNSIGAIQTNNSIVQQDNLDIAEEAQDDDDEPNDEEADDVDAEVEGTNSNAGSDDYKDADSGQSSFPDRSMLDVLNLMKTPAVKTGKTNSSRDERPKPPRKSLLLRNMEKVEKDCTPPNQHTVARPFTPRVKVNTIGQWVWFFQELFDYESETLLCLPLHALIEKTIREKIRLRAPSITKHAFRGLKRAQLLRRIQLYLAPRDANQFTYRLVKYAPFKTPPGYHPLCTDFSRFYDAYMAFNDLFREVYEFMAFDDTVEAIPACDYKEGGLIKTYVNAIPFGYGSKVYHALPTKKFTDIYHFMEVFEKHVETDNRISERAVILSQRFTRKPGDLPVNHIIDFDPDFHSDIDMVEPYSQLDAVDAADNDDLAGYDSGEVSDSLAAIAGTRPPDKQLPCFAMMRTGKCSREQACKYSHKAEDLAAGRKALRAELDSQETPKVHNIKSILKRGEADADA